ncbi:MAG: hypothetical protein DRI39_04945 [Chloroflexi bacterium]|nr:MAG: hypothetical protein DRI39_04945 [Chloroflexota bacterium]RLC96175.1 MAG: hypothetical protein DRI40_03895 [Chloroflexota bacterium]
MEVSFAVNSNAGKLARLLRMMGYDATFYKNIDDADLVRTALKQKRVLVTRDTQITRRRVVTNGQLRVILTRSDDPKEQLSQVVRELGLDCRVKQFTRCLECNRVLLPRTKEEVKGLVPPYVFRTQTQYMQCPECQRVYWRGTHWQRMKEELESLAGRGSNGDS